jgi:predicted DNA-binding transcriptional regulator YafY
MRRADRLFEIVQILRRRRLTTATQLADRLEVSERTVYRDIRDLIAAGVPIEGEAGLGYVLRGYDLPPLMFSEDEIEALVLGARTVESWADPELARAARSILDKVDAVLPERLRGRLEDAALFAPNPKRSRAAGETLGSLRRATREHRMVRFAYTDADGQQTQREVRPLCQTFWASVWLLSGWCELRDDFRSFRIDRIADLELLDRSFEEEPGRTLVDFLARVTGERTERR